VNLVDKFGNYGKTGANAPPSSPFCRASWSPTQHTSPFTLSFRDQKKMALSSSSSGMSKRPTTDFSAVDNDLAEWASRIKAMQAQVDADEEAEQRKLEEEIAASRLARLRRSHGVASASRLLDSELGGWSFLFASLSL
jgi:hypothetical protein